MLADPQDGSPVAVAIIDQEEGAARCDQTAAKRPIKTRLAGLAVPQQQFSFWVDW